jgi:hypothetical protein
LSCDLISKESQGSNEGDEVYIKAAFAAAVFEDPTVREYDLAEESMQQLADANGDIDTKLKAIGRAETSIVNEGRQLAEGVRSLRH